MVIRNYQDLPQTQTAHAIQAFKLHDSPNASMMHLLLLPGEELKPHITPVDVLFYILEGNPTILIGEAEYQAKQDDLIESPKDIVHCIYNRHSQNARVLVIKTPRPTTPTKFINKDN